MDYQSGYAHYLTEEKRASANTLSSYLRDVTQYLHWLEGEGVPPEQAAQKDVESYTRFLSAKGKSAATVTRSLASLKSFYSYLIAEGRVSVNPARGLAPAKVERKLPHILTSKEVELFLEQPDASDAKGCRDRAMLELLYATGIRVSELIGLDLENVNLSAGFIRCSGRGKERMIPLYPAAVRALQDYIEHVRPQMLEHPQERALFVNMSGERMSRQGFWKIIKFYGEKAGIQADDRIVKIDGQTLEGLSLNDAVGLLKNSENDTVTLSIEREGEADLIETEVKKEKLAAIVADGKMLDDKIGYLAISEFTGLTSEQFQKAYQSLQDQGMERLIIDLRGNPGGLVTAVCDSLRQILPEGLIVYTEDKNGKREEYTCDGDTPISIPLVVLVNENTASAAEIFTGAVKDYGIGTIVGMTTFGKGIVQNTFQLSDGSVVKLTIAHYYTPLGNDIHKVGIAPDVEVELPDDATSDVQLEKALEVVKGLEGAE